jgi:hypothetical protein
VRRPLSRTLALQGLQGAPGALARRARAMPSLDLRFAETKSLTDWISGQNLITFTRASSGTVVNAAGTLETVASNLPRLMHNPLTGESLGLLLEEQRTNLWTYSDDFANAAWSKVRSSITSNTIVAPDGTLTGDKLIASTDASTTHFVRQDVSVTSGTAYAQTIYAKAGEYTQIYMAFYADNSAFAGGSVIFTLTGNGIAGTPSGTLTSNSITPVGNGWYRCQIAATATATAAGVFRVQLATGDTNGFTGNGTSGIFIWGAQLEAGAFPTGYIPTTAATATRSADLADLISAAIANNIRAIYVEFRSPASGTRGVFSLNDNTANEQSAILTSGTDSALLVHDNGIEQANIIGGSIAAGARIRVACRINQDSFAISVNGGIARTDNTGTVPTVDRLMIGRTQAGDYLNASIARIVGWVEPLPDATLQAITR